MFPYDLEHYTSNERSILKRYFTNVDKPVFALVNLPEVVKGALFARYSRSPKSLRRLFLDEFVDDLDVSGDATVDATVGLKRAEALYERVFLEYGDDSVAQLGGVHLACEQASNVLTKILERGRLMSYLEQSTRYIGYDARLANGHYRYHRPPEVLDSSLGARYVGDMDQMFDAYGELLPKVQNWCSKRYPPIPGDSEIAHRQAVRAKALDSLRGLLPAAALSNVGIYGSGQAYEQLLLRMRANPLPEANAYAEMMLIELRKVIPSFLQRVDIKERGGAWSKYLATTRDDTSRLLERLWPEPIPSSSNETHPEVRLTDFDPDGENKVLAAICFRDSSVSESEAMRRIERLGEQERLDIMEAYVGDRLNRRHRPGRAFERTDYHFELVSDYGAFRDLQRHRMLSVEWQALTPSLGYDLPEAISESKQEARYVETLELSKDLYEALSGVFSVQAPYAVALAYKIRFTLQLNAREALHLIELRSSPQGHPSYRRIAQAMHRAIADVAGHKAIAAAMGYVDHSEPELERLDSERRLQKRRAAIGVKNSLTL